MSPKFDRPAADSLLARWPAFCSIKFSSTFSDVREPTTVYAHNFSLAGAFMPRPIRDGGWEFCVHGGEIRVASDHHPAADHSPP